jgi:hypothetical protein
MAQFPSSLRQKKGYGTIRNPLALASEHYGGGGSSKIRLGGGGACLGGGGGGRMQADKENITTLSKTVFTSNFFFMTRPPFLPIANEFTKLSQNSRDNYTITSYFMTIKNMNISRGIEKRALNTSAVIPSKRAMELKRS